MTDLLDLRGDERPAPRRRSTLPGGPARWLAVLVVLLLVVGIVFALAYAGQRVMSAFESAPDYEGPGSGEVVVQVQPGQTAPDVATTLRDADVIASRQAFLEVANADSRAPELQPGFYRMLQQMPAADAFDRLFDPSARVLGRVPVPEGLTVQQTLEVIDRNTELTLEQLQAAAADPAALGLPPYARGLEGFLFPATYEFDPGTTAVQALSAMVQRFEEAAAEVGLAERAPALNLTPYEAVTVASLIERESRIDDELPKVARVVYNRLQQDIPLGIDAAVLYGLGRTSGGLSEADLARDTPYNNRLHTGLPPTPIASPGQAALEAALNPAEGDWLYYVLADAEGRHLFTSDYNEFLRQKEQSQQEGLF